MLLLVVGHLFVYDLLLFMIYLSTIGGTLEYDLGTFGHHLSTWACEKCWLYCRIDVVAWSYLHLIMQKYKYNKPGLLGATVTSLPVVLSLDLSAFVT
jgi:hypothetical protein